MERTMGSFFEIISINLLQGRTKQHKYNRTWPWFSSPDWTSLWQFLICGSWWLHPSSLTPIETEEDLLQAIQSLRRMKTLHQFEMNYLQQSSSIVQEGTVSNQTQSQILSTLGWVGLIEGIPLLLGNSLTQHWILMLLGIGTASMNLFLHLFGFKSEFEREARERNIFLQIVSIASIIYSGFIILLYLYYLVSLRWNKGCDYHSSRFNHILLALDWFV